MTVQVKTWPYGTKRKAEIKQVAGPVMTAVDELGEGHVLVGVVRGKNPKPGEKGELVFTKGGITGGYWRWVGNE